MLVIVRFDPPADEPDFLNHASAALSALARCAGHRRGWFARSTDEPTTWVLCTEWETVGAYRRALSSYDVKIHAMPFMYGARDEVTAFEAVLSTDSSGSGEVATLTTDLADDAGTVGIGDFGPRGQRRVTDDPSSD